MPIGAFISQPISNSIAAAYRPVVIRVAATNTDATPIPPVVYCDIYFNDVFYKTLSKSQYTALNIGVNTEWEFDIQDAAQEYLQKFLGNNGEFAIIQATTLIAKTLCKFRSSGLDGNGFITPENDAPVQGTDSTPPVSGTGTSSNTFYVVNATLQHEDNQDLALHLFYFKHRTWNGDALPLTHRPDGYKIGPADSDVYPIIYVGTSTFKKIRLNYKFCGQSDFSQATLNVSGAPACNAIISNPVVTVNGLGWLVSWNLISGAPQKYFVSTPAVSGGAPLETIVTQYQYLTGDLPVGVNTITVRPLCLIDGEWYFGEAKTVDIIVAACTNVTIDGSQQLPDAVVGVAYNSSITLGGSQPFILSAIVKPAWMTVTLTGSTVSFTGIPGGGDTGININISFDASNCGGGGAASFADQIDVHAASPAVNSQLLNDTPNASSNILLAKTSAPFEVLIPFEPMTAGEVRDFFTANYVGVDIEFTVADFTPAAAVLSSNGNIYNGVITPNHILFSNVDIQNGMVITLT